MWLVQITTDDCIQSLYVGDGCLNAPDGTAQREYENGH
jgi:hypothetical protein